MIVLIAAAAVLVVGLAAVLAFGGGAWMSVRADAPTSTAAGRLLPDGEFFADDVERVRFDVAVRGYRMEQVDVVLERLRTRLAELEDEVSAMYTPHLHDDGPDRTSSPAGFPAVTPYPTGLGAGGFPGRADPDGGLPR